MSLHNYLIACQSLSLELQQSLTSDDIDALRTDLAELGLKAYRQWYREHLQEIEKFVSLTPSERSKKKRCQDNRLRRLLAYAAIQHCEMACHLLSAILDNMIEPGHSYRQIAALAGRAYYEACQKGCPAWPFDGESPF